MGLAPFVALLVSKQILTLVTLVMMAISGVEVDVFQSLLVVKLTAEVLVHYASKNAIIMEMGFAKHLVIQIWDTIP